MAIEQRHIAAYQSLFVHRKDIYARQRDNGSYFLRLSPITPQVIRAHLKGAVTIGLYALEQFLGKLSGRLLWHQRRLFRATAAERLSGRPLNSMRICSSTL
jgi:hypothetical protein